MLRGRVLALQEEDVPGDAGRVAPWRLGEEQYIELLLARTPRSELRHARRNHAVVTNVLAQTTFRQSPCMQHADARCNGARGRRALGMEHRCMRPCAVCVQYMYSCTIENCIGMPTPRW